MREEDAGGVKGGAVDPSEDGLSRRATSSGGQVPVSRRPYDAAARAFLGLGSNVGDSRRTLRWAVERVDGLPGTRVVARSALYRTAPVGRAGQADFLNQVIQIETRLSPWDLLAAVLEVERQGGRVRRERWGPRTLDIDVVWYDNVVVSEPDLEIPHPRLEERRFVLEPLSELAPDLLLPSGRTVGEALERVAAQRVEKLG